MMGMIEFQDGAIQIDATIIAEGLAIDPSVVQERIREGRITSRCERGIEQDEGRYRLTFFTENRRFRLVTDTMGNVVQRSTINFSNQPLPVSARRPG
jgi:hypothetical protein